MLNRMWRLATGCVAIVLIGGANAGADTPADRLLDKCIETERRVHAIKADFLLQGSDIQPVSGSMELQKPNLARISLKRSGSSDIMLTVSDGRRITIYSTEQKVYSQEPADIAGGNVTRDCEVMEAAAFFNPDLLDRMRFGHTVKLIANARLQGVICIVLQVTNDNGSWWKVYVGPDNLLRGYSQKIISGSQSVTRESRITGLQTAQAIAAAELAFRPSKGDRSVQQVEESRRRPESGTGQEELGLLPVGKPAPDFTLTALGGDNISLSAVARRNKVTLVNFWSAFCGPCRAELPELSKMQAQLRGRGFEILSINIGDDENKVNSIWHDGQLSMRALLHGDKIAEQYRVQAIPTNYLVGSDGRILARFMGFDESGIRQALAKAGLR